MEDLESKLNAVLENPQMMEKIMEFAQGFGTEQSDAFGGMDMQMLQKISSLAGQSNIDPKQKNLLSALSPYLNAGRISRLERAMRAARMARLASSFLGR